VSSDEGFVQYWSSPQTRSMEVIVDGEGQDEGLKKKLSLVRHFCEELKKRVNLDAACFQERNIAIDHVKYWAKTVDGMLFRFASRNVQASFSDHTKVFIESKTRRVLFYDKEEVHEFGLEELKAQDETQEIRKKLAMIKGMSQKFSCMK
jgi:hypothetical protein